MKIKAGILKLTKIHEKDQIKRLVQGKMKIKEKLQKPIKKHKKDKVKLMAQELKAECENQNFVDQSSLMKASAHNHNKIAFEMDNTKTKLSEIDNSEDEAGEAPSEDELPEEANLCDDKESAENLAQFRKLCRNLDNVDLEDLMQTNAKRDGNDDCGASEVMSGISGAPSQLSLNDPDEDAEVIEHLALLEKICSNYRPKKPFPKTLKMLPRNPNWNELLERTNFPEWSMYAVSSIIKYFKARGGEVIKQFLREFLLPYLQEHIVAHRELKKHLYEAIFDCQTFRCKDVILGLWLPWVEKGMTKLEAKIVCSILRRASISMAYAAATISYLLQQPRHSYAQLLVIQTLLQKRYSMPDEVIHEVVQYFVGFERLSQSELLALDLIDESTMLTKSSSSSTSSASQSSSSQQKKKQRNNADQDDRPISNDGEQDGVEVRLPLIWFETLFRLVESHHRVMSVKAKQDLLRLCKRYYHAGFTENIRAFLSTPDS